MILSLGWRVFAVIAISGAATTTSQWTVGLYSPVSRLPPHSLKATSPHGTTYLPKALGHGMNGVLVSRGNGHGAGTIDLRPESSPSPRPALVDVRKLCLHARAAADLVDLEVAAAKHVERKDLYSGLEHPLAATAHGRKQGDSTLAAEAMPAQMRAQVVVARGALASFR